jgi:hypothetical protein
MIDLFRDWLSQIIGYAKALQDGTIERAWAEGDRSSTSVYFSGELYEQVFGDLHADSMLEEARQSLAPSHSQVVNALASFLLSLKRLDEWVEAHVDTKEWGKGQTIPASVRSIFDAPEWRDANSAAGALLVAAGKAGFRPTDWDPTQTLH